MTQAVKRVLWVSPACLAGAAAQAQAQSSDAYPAKLVRIVVPFAAGGSTDLLARSVAQRLNEAWRQPVIVENRAGGGGIVGSELVARAPADGYTLLVGTVTTHGVAPSLYRKLPFDSQHDFAPVTEFALIPQVLSVHPSLPVKSVKELVALARARPAELNYGTAGNGSASHMAMELFQSVAKVKLTHVPYKGTGPALAELLGGHLSLMFDVVMTSLPHMQAGRLKPLAVSSLQRSQAVQQLPTVAELGYPGFEAIVWFGLFAPANTPGDIVKRIHEEVARSLRLPKMQELLSSQGLEIVASTPAQFGARVAAEIAKWRKVISDAGIKAEL
ncbi:MAG: tripartite tricarboxylate transporter substrate binding protein [Betaproteobacteria bacterium]|nr:tripartite tricarboxylate transporter substrate binding protein [Betaproteobacteria bacterium]